MNERQRVRFPSTGVGPQQLEGELWMPDANAPSACVVVAHPHPQRGGSMDNNVVLALCDGLAAAGIASLRFNFRGVGQSQGTYGRGIDEVSDVLGALRFISEQQGISSGRVGLAGYSFGARVSLAAAVETPLVHALLCVAPPLSEPLPADKTPSCPFLVLVGDHDHVAAAGLDAYASCLPDRNCLHVVPGPDHFWLGFEPVLADAAKRFFTEALPPIQ